MYHDGILCAIYHDRETPFVQKTLFLEFYAVALLFLSFFRLLLRHIRA